MRVWLSATISSTSSSNRSSSKVSNRSGPGLYGVRRLMQPADGVLDIVMFQQAAAFSPKLGELDVDGIQLGGAGIRVQQPAACSLLMLWLCSAAWAMAG